MRQSSCQSLKFHQKIKLFFSFSKEGKGKVFFSARTQKLLQREFDKEMAWLLKVGIKKVWPASAG